MENSLNSPQGLDEETYAADPNKTKLEPSQTESGINICCWEPLRLGYSLLPSIITAKPDWYTVYGWIPTLLYMHFSN